MTIDDCRLARGIARIGNWQWSIVKLALVLGLTAVPAAAQTPDRTRPPQLPPPAELKLPPIQQARLPNGVTIHLAEMHEVPLVQVALRVKGGGRLDGGLPGLASFTADMLDEGAGDRDAFGIAAQAAYLGADLSTGADWDYLEVDLNTPKRTLGAALDLMADVALRPNFHSADVARQRDLRIAQIIQQRDQPNGMATLAFGALLYPAGHPYHRPLGGDSAATARLDSATVRGFYHRVFRPDQAELIITGDITLAEARAEFSRRFGSWAAGRTPAPRPPAVRTVTAPARRTIYLVNKPGAAQSVIMIGEPGVSRTSPDYPAIQVMNTILGGSFSSRLNQDLRETKGFTYGAGSQFVFRPLPGPFIARSAVRTDVTDSSLVEFFRQLDAIRDSAVSGTELTRARNYIALGLPDEFETTEQMADEVGELLTYGLPPAYFTTYARQVMAVTAADVQRVARRYIDPARVAVVVVGDVARIRPGIEALGLGPVSLRDLEGREVGR
jgi:predicted Zn-dependent peptidase